MMKWEESIALPNKVLAKHRMVVVLPTPGGPLRMMLGTFPFSANTSNRLTTSSLPTMSPNFCGRYFSTLSKRGEWLWARLINWFLSTVSSQLIRFNLTYQETSWRDLTGFLSVVFSGWSTSINSTSVILRMGWPEMDWWEKRWFKTDHNSISNQKLIVSINSNRTNICVFSNSLFENSSAAAAHTNERQKEFKQLICALFCVGIHSPTGGSSYVEPVFFAFAVGARRRGFRFLYCSVCVCCDARQPRVWTIVELSVCLASLHTASGFVSVDSLSCGSSFDFHEISS